MRGFTSSDQAQVVEFLATKQPRDLRDEALDDLRNELAETRAERDRLRGAGEVAGGTVGRSEESGEVISDIWIVAVTRAGLGMIQDRRVHGYGALGSWLSCSTNTAFAHNKTELIRHADIRAAGSREFCEAAKRLLELP